MRHYQTLLLLSSFTLFGTTFSSGKAAACSPPMPGILSTIPSNDEVYPANASVVLSGYSLKLSEIIAKADGIPIEIKSVNSLLSSSDFQSTYAIVFEPALKVGQKVELSGSVCSDPGPSCNLSLNFTVGEMDLTPPGQIDQVTVNIHDYNDFKSSGGDCQSNSDLAFYVSIQGQKSEDPGYLRVTGYDAATGKQELFSRTIARSDSSENLAMIRLAKDALLGNAIPSGVCVEVVGFDLAGNQTKPFRQCSPCHFREDPPGDPNQPGSFGSPNQPEWTAADIVQGGACDAGGAGGSAQGGTGGSAQGGAGQGGGENAGTGGSTKEEGGPQTNPISNSGDDGGCSVSIEQSSSTLRGLWVAIAALGVYWRRRRS